MNPYEHAYLISNILLSPIWLFLYTRRPDVRKKLLAISIFGGITALVTSPFFLHDYWHPPLLFNLPVGIEDFLFGFFAGGIASVLYEEFYGKRFARRKNNRHHWSLFTACCFILFLLFFLVYNLGYGINSVYAGVLVLLAWALLIIYYRRDFLFDVVFSGVAFAFFYFLFFLLILHVFPEIVERFWKLENISGDFIAGVPLEELLWALSWGMVAGPLYEFFFGLKLAKN